MVVLLVQIVLLVFSIDIPSPAITSRNYKLSWNLHPARAEPTYCRETTLSNIFIVTIWIQTYEMMEGDQSNPIIINWIVHAADHKTCRHMLRNMFTIFSFRISMYIHSLPQVVVVFGQHYFFLTTPPPCIQLPPDSFWSRERPKYHNHKTTTKLINLFCDNV